jgi:hypothetical protein
VAQLVEALRYNPEGPGFDSRSGKSFRPYYVPGVVSAPITNAYQGCLLGGKGGQCVGLTT